LVTADIPNLSWNKITSDKPTTLSGYGITDAAPAVEGGYLPLSGGTMINSINRYYNAADGTPMITIRSNNKNIIVFNIGHASSSSGTISSNYTLQYTGAGDNPNNKLVLTGYNANGTAATAISIN